MPTKPTDSQLLNKMSTQIAEMYGSMYGVGNTEGTVSTVRRLDKALAVHKDGSRAEARRTAVLISTITTVGLFIINIFISVTTGLPMIGK